MPCMPGGQAYMGSFSLSLPLFLSLSLYVCLSAFLFPSPSPSLTLRTRTHSPTAGKRPLVQVGFPGRLGRHSKRAIKPSVLPAGRRAASHRRDAHAQPHSMQSPSPSPAAGVIPSGRRPLTLRRPHSSHTAAPRPRVSDGILERRPLTLRRGPA
jgi:hypothetical protein